MARSVLFLMALLPITATLAFTAFSTTTLPAATTFSALNAVGSDSPAAVPPPKYNKATDLWEYMSDDHKPTAGYDEMGTLLRHGPKPFLIRTFQNDKYEQAVLKFIAGDKVDRNQAQGNMDAYFSNAQDWAYQRFQDYTPDYAKDPDVKQLALTVVWGSAALGAVARGVYCAATGDSFYAIIGFSHVV